MSIDGFASQYNSGIGDFDSKAERLLAEKVVIDGTDTDTFTVRKNQNGDNVFVVDTTNSTTTITGDLTVIGNASFTSTDNFAVADNLISMASGNTGGDLLDGGFYMTYNDGATKYAGLFRDQSDSGIWKLVQGITTEPGAGSNFPADVSANKASLLCGDITGDTITATTKFLSASGDATAPGLSFSADPDTGIFNSTNILGFATNGASRMTIGDSAVTMTGSLQVKNTLKLSANDYFINAIENAAIDTYINNGWKMRVGTGAIEHYDKTLLYSSGPQLTMSVSNGSGQGYVQFGTNTTGGEETFNWHMGSQGDGNFYILNNVYGSGSTKMTITSGGNVGIGTSPSAKLHVLSTGVSMRLAYDASNYADFQIGNTGNLVMTPVGTATATKIKGDYFSLDAEAGQDDAFLRSYNSNTSGTARVRARVSSGNYIQMLSVGTGVGGNIFGEAQAGRSLLFSKNAMSIGTEADELKLATANAVRMTIDTSGNVGIGIAPASKLHLYDATNGVDFNMTTNKYQLNPPSDTDIHTIRMGWDWRDGTGEKNAEIVAMARTANFMPSIDFRTLHTYGTPVSRMIITESGFVGIGTSNPRMPFQIGDVPDTGTRYFYDLDTDYEDKIEAVIVSSLADTWDGQANSSSYHGATLYLGNLDEISSDSIAGSLEFGQRYGAYGQVAHARIGGFSTGVAFQGGLKFQTLNGGALTTAMTIDYLRNVNIGVEDTSQGILNIMGGGGSGAGGRLRIFNSASDDTSTDYWELGANGESLSFVQGAGGFTKMTLTTSGNVYAGVSSGIPAAGAGWYTLLEFSTTTSAGKFAVNSQHSTLTAEFSRSYSQEASVTVLSRSAYGGSSAGFGGITKLRVEFGSDGQGGEVQGYYNGSGTPSFYIYLLSVYRGAVNVKASPFAALETFSAYASSAETAYASGIETSGDGYLGGNLTVGGTLTVGGGSVLTQTTGSWSGGITTTWSCVAANQSVTVKWTKTGNVVHLNIATMTTTADATGTNPTNMIIESLPATIKPTTLVSNTSLIRTTSGGTIRSGSASIDPTNSWIAITYNSNDVTADWDNSTGSTVGFYQSCISYTLD